MWKLHIVSHFPSIVFFVNLKNCITQRRSDVKNICKMLKNVPQTNETQAELADGIKYVQTNDELKTGRHAIKNTKSGNIEKRTKIQT